MNNSRSSMAPEQQQHIAQVYTYVTDNAYVCLTVCLTWNEELFG